MSKGGRGNQGEGTVRWGIGWLLSGIFCLVLSPAEALHTVPEGEKKTGGEEAERASDPSGESTPPADSPAGNFAPASLRTVEGEQADEGEPEAGAREAAEPKALSREAALVLERKKRWYQTGRMDEEGTPLPPVTREAGLITLYGKSAPVAPGQIAPPLSTGQVLLLIFGMGLLFGGAAWYLLRRKEQAWARTRARMKKIYRVLQLPTDWADGI